jgi:hypothetical protein
MSADILEGVLSTRCRNCLKNEAPSESKDWTEDQWKAFALSRTEWEWLRTPNFGIRSLIELNQWAGLRVHVRPRQAPVTNTPVTDAKPYVSRYPGDDALKSLDEQIAKAKAELSALRAKREEIKAAFKWLKSPNNRADKFYSFAKAGWSVKQIAIAHQMTRQQVRNAIRHHAEVSAERVIGPYPARGSDDDKHGWNVAFNSGREKILQDLPGYADIEPMHASKVRSREVTIAFMRGNGETYKEIGQALGISGARVRQIFQKWQRVNLRRTSGTAAPSSAPGSSPSA